MRPIPSGAAGRDARRLVFSILATLAVVGPVFSPTAVFGAGEDKAKAAQLMQDYRRDLVLVEGQNGRASGFIADVKGRKYFVSNAHVLASIKSPRFKLLDNSPLKLGPAMVAVGHDIIMVNVLEGGKGIPTVPFGVVEAQFADPVVVPGNAGGESVVNPLQGEIVGIGADRIEISAPIEPGSSGSPIIHVRSGKAVGVATYLKIKPDLTRSSTNGFSETKVRRFGYRLDTVQRWEGVDWSRFYAEADILRNIEKTSEELVMAFWDLGSSSSTNQERHLYDSREISAALDQYFDAMHQRTGDGNTATRQLVDALRKVNQGDVTPPRTFTYDFFRRRFQEEAALRKEISEALEKVLRNMN